MELFGEQLALGTGIFLILALLMALGFEFVNGFHDTANAVATVIYTHSLRPVVAVVWSGFCNLMGVLTSSGAVAFGIVALLPVELVLSAFLKTTGHLSDKTFGAIAAEIQNLQSKLQGKSSFSEVPKEERSDLRTTFYLVHASISKLRKQHLITDKPDDAALGLFASGLKSTTDFIPPWVKVAVAVALGCGTMIGWKRIVVTVGEKIGKSHLTYAQGASAELVAMATIQVADIYGLPVSTTHVLSSGIAGTMAANRSGLQMATLRNIILAWVLTVPVCVFLGAATFSAGLFVVFNILHWK